MMNLAVDLAARHPSCPPPIVRQSPRALEQQ